MSDHVLECRWESQRCICEELRACEQRVLDDDVLAAAYHGQAGYAAGVQAAREAVAAVSVRKDTSHDMRVQALAAIDTLRGES